MVPPSSVTWLMLMPDRVRAAEGLLHNCCSPFERESQEAGRCLMRHADGGRLVWSWGQVTEGRHGDLNTFALFNKRRKVTSSAKRRRREGSLVVAQTPDGSFRDLMSNARELLLDYCKFESVPKVMHPKLAMRSGV